MGAKSERARQGPGAASVKEDTVPVNAAVRHSKGDKRELGHLLEKGRRGRFRSSGHISVPEVPKSPKFPISPPIIWLRRGWSPTRTPISWGAARRARFNRSLSASSRLPRVLVLRILEERDLQLQRSI